MALHILQSLLISVTSLLLVKAVAVLRSDDYALHAVDEPLDPSGKYLLSWNANFTSNVITFEIEAETKGFVGFGISPNGQMGGADIFVAGVLENGSSYAFDMFAERNGMPNEDTHNDWTLLEAREDASKTYIKASRKLQTCDDQDYPISNDTVRLIWSMGDSDTLAYHGSNRGTKSVNLLMPDPEDFDPDLYLHWDIEMEIEMPPEDTTYWCSIHKAPLLNQTHHIVAFEPLLPSELAEVHTHHFMLYKCVPPEGQTADEAFGQFIGFPGANCYLQGDEQPLPMDLCYGRYKYIWSKGGRRMLFPENVGHPFPEVVGENNYYMYEIHIDNPNQLEDVRFTTGARVSYTSQLREIEAGLLSILTDVDQAYITIPPNQENFIVTSQCGSQCTSQILPEDGINVFNSMLHSHISGRKIRTRHIRGDLELPWLDNDDRYDFNFQQNKPLRDPVQVLPGDHLAVECTYSSTWINNTVVVGGMSTREEMCMAVMWYYPKLDSNFDYCGSHYPVEKHFEEFGITNWELIIPRAGLPEYRILEPLELAGDYVDVLSTKFAWNETFIREYERRRRYDAQIATCLSPGVVQFPDDFVKYVPENPCNV